MASMIISAGPRPPIQSFLKVRFLSRAKPSFLARRRAARAIGGWIITNLTMRTSSSRAAMGLAQRKAAALFTLLPMGAPVFSDGENRSSRLIFGLLFRRRAIILNYRQRGCRIARTDRFRFL